MFQSAFDEIDADHDKQLTIDEVAAVTGQSRTSLETQLAKIDLDHSGTINFIEFLYAMFQTRGESYIMNGKLTFRIKFFCDFCCSAKRNAQLVFLDI